MRNAFKVVTFDCYGTLVRWHEEISSALDAILRGKGIGQASAFVSSFNEIRHRRTSGAYLPYKEILRQSLADALAVWGLPCDETDTERLLRNLNAIAPFPEVPQALAEVRKKFKMAIISNSDQDLIAGSVERIGVPFDRVFVGTDIHAYKPSLELFRFAARELGVGPEEMLHVGASQPLDIEPAHILGIQKVWINRRGEVADSRWKPYLELPDLTNLPNLLLDSKWPL